MLRRSSSSNSFVRPNPAASKRWGDARIADCAHTPLKAQPGPGPGTRRTRRSRVRARAHAAQGAAGSGPGPGHSIEESARGSRSRSVESAELSVLLEGGALDSSESAFRQPCAGGRDAPPPPHAGRAVGLHPTAARMPPARVLRQSLPLTRGPAAGAAVARPPLPVRLASRGRAAHRTSRSGPHAGRAVVAQAGTPAMPALPSESDSRSAAAARRAAPS